MSLYNFKSIVSVPQCKDLVDVVLSKTQRKTPTVVHKGYKIARIRKFYMTKVKFCAQTVHEKLDLILKGFPKVDDIHPFYADLINILYDKDHYKLALGQLNTAKSLVDNVGKDYHRLLKFGDSLYRCKQLKRAAFGRVVTILKKQKSSLEYLEQVRQHMSRLPSIDPTTRTLVLCGFPNVGKSSFLNSITRADVEVQPYAFTTKSLYVGHTDYKYLRWQVLDTPGILDHALEERNTIEMQAVTALAHLRAAIVYVMDLSEQCGRTIEEQIKLFDSIAPLFAGKPLVIALNKSDVMPLEALPEEKRELVEALSKRPNTTLINQDDDNDGQTTVAQSNIPVLPMSTVSQHGVVAVKACACDALLAQRVQAKYRAAVSRQAAEAAALEAQRTGPESSAVTPAPAQVSLLAKMHVAFPAQRHDVGGARQSPVVCIPPEVLARRERWAQRQLRAEESEGKADGLMDLESDDSSGDDSQEEEENGGNLKPKTNGPKKPKKKRINEGKMRNDIGGLKLECHIEREEGDEYVLDVKKRFMLEKDEWKYDVVPEVWRGKNVADYIDPNIDVKLAALEAEERELEAAGFYDSEIDSDDPDAPVDAERRAKKELARRIREKKALVVLESRQRRRQQGAKLTRVDRGLDLQRMRNELAGLGIDVSRLTTPKGEADDSQYMEIDGEVKSEKKSADTGTHLDVVVDKSRRRSQSRARIIEKKIAEYRNAVKLQQKEEREARKRRHSDVVAMETDEAELPPIENRRQKRQRLRSEHRLPASVRATSRSVSRAPSRDRSAIGLRDAEQVRKTKEMRGKAQHLLAKVGRRSEADHRIVSKRPKHLFAGKRPGQGTANHR